MKPAATPDQISGNVVSWVALVEPATKVYVCAEWKRGEPAPTLDAYVHGVQVMREDMHKKQAAELPYLGSALLLTSETDERWFSVQSGFEPQWLPAGAVATTQ